MILVIKDGKVFSTHNDSQDVINLYSEDFDIIKVTSMEDVPFNNIVISEERIEEAVYDSEGNELVPETKLPAITIKEYLDPRTDTSFDYIDMRNTLTTEQQLGQQITDLELANLSLQQKNAEYESRLVALEGK